MGIFGIHQTVFDSDNWLTPPDLLERLGHFDLDPCATDEPRPWPTAARHYVRADDGLTQPWEGRIFLNPPYGQPSICTPWLRKMAAHADGGIALTFARTETAMWHAYIWPYASGIMFLEGRVFFHRPDGSRARNNAGGPSALIAYGELNVTALLCSGLAGVLVRPIVAQSARGGLCDSCHVPLEGGATINSPSHATQGEPGGTQTLSRHPSKVVETAQIAAA